jgi:hypothetical protein
MMNLGLVRASAQLEQTDELHLIRVLLILLAARGRTNKPLEGLTKLAKMDFLLRYPSCLERALVALQKDPNQAEVQRFERETIEASMIRFKYGPWDKRYRKWLSLLVAKGLVDAVVEGNTINLSLSDRGLALAEEAASRPEFQKIAERSGLIQRIVGSFGAAKLRDFIYDTFPEIRGLSWGQEIRL